MGIKDTVRNLFGGGEWTAEDEREYQKSWAEYRWEVYGNLWELFQDCTLEGFISIIKEQQSRIPKGTVDDPQRLNVYHDIWLCGGYRS